MPLYPYKCKTCGKEEDFLLDYEHKDPLCCNNPMERTFTTFGFSVDFKEGWDAGAGRYFDTKRERNNWIAENNLRRIS